MITSNGTQQEFESMFGSTSPEEKSTGSGFSFSETDSIFTSTPTVEPEVPTAVKTPEELAAEEAQALIDKEASKETEDSLFKGDKIEVTQKALDLKAYFDIRIKEGKFLPLEDGKMESPEDFDTLIEANFSHKIEEIKDDVAKSWYQTQSPAWQFIAANAEKFTNPRDLIPILQGVDNIDTITGLDPNNADQAEKIVRIALTKRNESPEIIEEQIVMYKETDKLAKIAAQYQPVLINEENKAIAEIAKRKDAEDLANMQMIQKIHENAVATLETPFLGKHKLKVEEKRAIYQLIAEPNEQEGGYKIFSEIDKLYENNDFETLREVALLLNNKKAHRHYLGVTIATENSEGIMRKLKTTSTGSTSQDAEVPDQPRVQRPPTNIGGNGSGFGFFSK